MQNAKTHNNTQELMYYCIVLHNHLANILPYDHVAGLPFCRDIKSWRDLLNFCAFWGQKQCLLGKKCSITWYILHIILI